MKSIIEVEPVSFAVGTSPITLILARVVLDSTPPLTVGANVAVVVDPLDISTKSLVASEIVPLKNISRSVLAG